MAQRGVMGPESVGVNSPMGSYPVVEWISKVIRPSLNTRANNVGTVHSRSEQSKKHRDKINDTMYKER